MIRVKDLSKHFGGIKAVNDISLTIAKGAITGFIGPNGAGKTTLFNIIAGHYAPTNGKIFLHDEDVTGLKPHELFHKGLLRTFQIAHEFANMTVLENLLVVPAHQIGENIFSTWLKRGKIVEQERQIREKAFEVVEFLQISHLANEYAGNLSGGQKKLLELGRTMMSDAKVVLLDEIGAGVNRTLLGEIGDAILKLNQERNYTFCMIEHDIDFIEKLCDRVFVLADGNILTQGKISEIKRNEKVIEAYLGAGNAS